MWSRWPPFSCDFQIISWLTRCSLVRSNVSPSLKQGVKARGKSGIAVHFSGNSLKSDLYDCCAEGILSLNFSV